MSSEVTSNQVFESSGRSPYISVTITASTGTATVQKLAGSDESGTWVSVTDGSVANMSGELTLLAPVGQKFRITLTGDAAAFVTR